MKRIDARSDQPIAVLVTGMLILCAIAVPGLAVTASSWALVPLGVLLVAAGVFVRRSSSPKVLRVALVGVGVGFLVVALLAP